jgi:hypothetical protein
LQTARITHSIGGYDIYYEACMALSAIFLALVLLLKLPSPSASVSETTDTRLNSTNPSLSSPSLSFSTNQKLNEQQQNSEMALHQPILEELQVSSARPTWKMMLTPTFAVAVASQVGSNFTMALVRLRL